MKELNSVLFAAILDATSEIDQQKVDEARKRRDLDLKFKGMIREIVWQLIMLLLFTWVIVGGLDANVFYQNQDIKNVFIEDAGVKRFTQKHVLDI